MSDGNNDHDHFLLWIVLFFSVLNGISQDGKIERLQSEVIEIQRVKR